MAVSLLDLPIIEVVWVDACTRDSWHTLEDARSLEFPKCRTVGRLVNKSSECVRLAPTINSEGGLAGTWSIPRSWITKITVLRKGKRVAT